MASACALMALLKGEFDCSGTVLVPRRVVARNWPRNLPATVTRVGGSSRRDHEVASGRSITAYQSAPRMRRHHADLEGRELVVVHADICRTTGNLCRSPVRNGTTAPHFYPSRQSHDQEHASRQRPPPGFIRRAARTTSRLPIFAGCIRRLAQIVCPSLRRGSFLSTADGAAKAHARRSVSRGRPPEVAFHGQTGPP